MKFVDEFRDPAAARALVKSHHRAGRRRPVQVHGGVRRPHAHHLPARHRARAARSRRAGARARLPGVRDPDGPGRRRDVAGRDARRHLHDVRRHDARARVARATCSRPRRAAPTCGSSTRRSTRCKIARRQPRPPRGVLRGRLRDHRAVHRGHAGSGARDSASRTSACSATTSRSCRRSRPSSSRPTCGSTGFLGPGHVSTVVGNSAVPVRARGVRKADGGGGFRAARHPRVGAHAAAADPRGTLRGREPVHPGGARRGQHRRR